MAQPAGLAAELTALWDEHDGDVLLSERARQLAAGSATDWGLPPNVDWDVPRISLGGGIPDPETLPRAALLAALERVLSTEDETPLRYGGALGAEPLRAQLAKRYGKLTGLELTAEHFMLTNGAAGAIASTCAALLDPGDVVVSEAPVFSGSLRTFRGHGAEIVAVGMDEEGLDVRQLEETLDNLERSGRRAKLVYTVSNFQNPTGVAMSTARRIEVLRAAARHGVLLLDDDAYGEIYFGSERPPMLAALAGGRGVVTAGSLSKTIATGLRVGWVQAEPWLIEELARMRFDMGNSPLLHLALAELLASGDYDRHVEAMRELYARKADALYSAITEFAAPYVECVRPVGGYFLWVRLRGGLSASAVQRAALEEGVMFPFGHAFFPDREDSTGEHIRLAYSSAPIEDLAEAAARIARACERVAAGSADGAL